MRLRLSVRATRAPACDAITCAMRCLFPDLEDVRRETVQRVCRAGRDGAKPRLERVEGDSVRVVMLRAINALRWGNTSVATWVLMMFAVLVPITGAGAQGSERPPSPADAMEAYRAVRGWIDTGAIGDAEEDWAASDPEGLRSACVTLRLEGRVIGRGLSWEDDEHDLQRATRRAWSRARGTMGAGLDDRARDIAVDLELGGGWTPLVGEGEMDFLSQVNPGMDGLAVRAGERTGVTFPGQMLASAWTPAQAMTHAIGPLDLPMLDFEALRSRYGLVVYRFATEHLAQPRAHAEPVFLRRGGRTVGMGDVRGAAILESAAEAAGFLARLAWPGPEPHGIRGDYDPIADAHEPAIAPHASQAIAAWALAVHAGTPGVDAAVAARSLRAAREILSEFTLATEFEEDPGLDPGALALWLVALRECGGAAGFADEEEAARIVDFGDGVRTGLLSLTEDAEERDALPGVVRALIALALAREADHADDGAACARRAEEMVRWLYVETEPGNLVSLMPWLGLASVSLAGDGDVGTEAALREMRSVIWRFMIASADTDASTSDLVGGVVFTRGTAPLPSWQTLRPTAFLAVMAGDARLTDASERGEAWGSLTESLRFAMQLQADESCGHMFVRPDAARGGVRLALWDQRCSVNATALALVSWCEALRSAERMSGAGE